jgi:hypothetical protein
MRAFIRSAKDLGLMMSLQRPFLSKIFSSREPFNADFLEFPTSASRMIAKTY